MTALTIFCTPKKFEGHTEIIQTNAIKSWLRIKGEIEIILLGPENNPAFNKIKNIKTHKKIETDSDGRPLISSLFEIGQKMAKNEIVCYINADIILPKNFLEIVKKIAHTEDNFLIIGRRIDQDIKTKIKNNKWPEIFNNANNCKKQLEWYIDYFCFKKGLFTKMPPFSVGRVGWDNWTIYNAIFKGAKVIDASQDIIAIHQNHNIGKFNSRAEMERSEGDKKNIFLAGGRDYFFGITDAQFLLKKGILVKNKTLIHYFRLFEKSYVLHPKLKILKIIIRPISFILKQLYELKSPEITIYKFKVIYWKIKKIISFSKN